MAKLIIVLLFGVALIAFGASIGSAGNDEVVVEKRVPGPTVTVTQTRTVVEKRELPESCTELVAGIKELLSSEGEINGMSGKIAELSANMQTEASGKDYKAMVKTIAELKSYVDKMSSTVIDRSEKYNVLGVKMRLCTVGQSQ